jgi:TonB family protein
MQEGLSGTEVWTRWTGQVVDGLFPLESCIGNSDHSGVFLTASPAGNASKAALKLVRALPTFAERQLVRWRTATGLSHPHLARLLHTGRCQLAENQYLYVVMEYADQNLAELLLRRALTREEAWELLLPTVDALAFLHRRHLVQGSLKPSNILVVGDTVKLSSDTIRAADEVVGSNGGPSVYDPPEASGGSAGDIWALGVTLAEGLMRAQPSVPVEPGKEPLLPQDFPSTFADAVRRCLSYEPTERPSVADLKAWMGAQQLVVSIPPAAADVATMRQSTPSEAPEQPAKPRLPENAAPKPSFATRRSPAFPIAGSVVILLVCWVAVRVLSGPGPNPPATVAPAPAKLAAPARSPESAESPQSAEPTEVAERAESAELPAQPAAFAPDAAPKPAGAPDPIKETQQPSQTAYPASAPDTDAATAKAVVARSVLHKEIPKVPRAARETIQEDVGVIVRVTVDSSGAVVRAVLADPGPSTYFAQLAINAARNWKFAEAQNQPSRHWLVRFVFARAGTTARAIRLRLARVSDGGP